MAQISRHEELVPWQRARDLTRLVYVVSKYPGLMNTALGRELQRSAILIATQIASAFDLREQERYCRQKLAGARAACGGLRWLLTVAHEQGKVTPDAYEELSARQLEIRQLLFALEHMLLHEGDAE
jgi:four helix bundle protein